MNDKRECSECGLPRISTVRRWLNWSFATFMAAYGAPMFFCRSCGRCHWPGKKRGRHQAA